jgi:hypothetical protein
MEGHDKVAIIRDAQYAFHRAMEAINRRETSLSALAKLRDAADVARRGLELSREDDFPIAQSCWERSWMRGCRAASRRNER